ncbi:hypothetical protein [Propionimicrobium sp. PCR01-08-3]|uniref:NfeD family protein n=1 Tax=Propionimicrobium sp. PCR01-08-3 TaxID=3052086 RepID=UPI00255C4570|nr:hypothetical protein [Propionimicrobium sp. PCR01-08-3]WIY82818.1 hypothetical protein QQ658_00180 [Propionimicrobium sp. PCR01-08-3]
MTDQYGDYRPSRGDPTDSGFDDDATRDPQRASRAESQGAPGSPAPDGSRPRQLPDSQPLSQQPSSPAYSVNPRPDDRPASAAPDDPHAVDGLGDAPAQPIVSLPPVAAEVAGYPVSDRTGEPKRPGLVVGATAAFAASALVAVATYWWYWWAAINIENFATSSKLIELFNPRPGSGSSVVLVCVMAIIGVVMTAAPAVAGYNAWHGAAWSRVAGIVSCVTGLLAFFVIPWTWLALVFAAIGTVLIWLPSVKPFFEASELFANPPRPAVVPKKNVAYGPAPRFR